MNQPDWSARKPARRLRYLLACDLAIMLMEWIALCLSWEEHQWALFRFYTQDSGVFALIACMISAACTLVCMGKNRPMFRWARLLRYFAACCSAVTLLVSVFVIVPSMEDVAFVQFMFEGKYLYLHTLCPLALILSFVRLQRGRRLGWRHAFMSLIPTLLYLVISILMNARQVYSGPYPFLKVHRQPPEMTIFISLLILAIGLASARILGALSGRRRKNAGV